jgi:membrane protein DedA with SNARE-associated domain
MIFLTVAAASLLGAFLGNLAVFYILGTMAKKVEQQQQAQLEELHKSYVDMVQKENERMRNYAKMEG